MLIEENQIKQKKRNPILDCCKGLGIVFVVMWHSHLLLPDLFPFFIFNLFFFCLAGILIKPEHIVKTKEFLNYLYKISKRYAKPYILYNLMFLAFYNIFVKYNLITNDYRYAEAPHILSIQEIVHKALLHMTVLSRSELLSGGSWFLKSLFWGLLSFAMIMFVYNKVIDISFFRKIKYHKIVLYSCITLIGTLILHFTNIRGVYFYFQTLICIFIGDLIKPYIEKLNTNYYLFTLSIILMIVGNYIKIRFLAVIVFCIGTFIFLYELSKIIKNFSKSIFNFFVFLGQNTIPILIFHFIGFKFITFIYMRLHNLNLDILGSFPIITNSDGSDICILWRVLYLVCGILFSLLLMICSKIISQKLKNLVNTVFTGGGSMRLLIEGV